MLLWLLIIGGVSALFLAVTAVRGPSASKNLKRRVELIKERHGDVIAGNAQAQIRKLFAERASRFEGYASTLIPKPALLRKRLEMTGKDISLAKYLSISIGIVVLVCLALMMRGAPFILSLLLGVFFGIGGPHFFIGKMIKRRINKFNSNFPDAIELMVRGLRSGLPITETLGIVAGEISGARRDRIPDGRRQDEDRPDDGSRAAGNCGPSRDRRIPVFRDYAGDPA